MSVVINSQLDEFAKQNDLVGLTAPSLEALLEEKHGYTIEKGQRFLAFQERINRELLQHAIITDNSYTTWFRQGEQTREQVREFVRQFSVFSNLFLIAQLNKMINADSLDGMRASKEILANEIGVVFNTRGARPRNGNTDSEGEGAVAVEVEVDPELVSCVGTVEGGVFRFGAGHFEWLLRIAKKLDLEFNDVGKRRHGTESTLFFCDELRRLYGSEDYEVSQASSYAVENWAAAGFWDELVEGFQKYNERTGDKLPLAFFTWHSRLEAQHAQHTQEELEELYFDREFDEDAFIRFGNEMLDGVAAFWNGLEDQRKALESSDGANG
jgi:pyrroloquinoline quinone (PQQ) biosynthesis protein C